VVLIFFKKFTLLQFDAHSDLRDSWLGSKFSHASVMRRCLELDKNINLVQIKGLIAPDFLAAKLIYKFIGYLVKYNLRLRICIKN